ncbi:MAG: class I SAM-dependent methyltransferase [Cyanobacteria bacterium SZAS LIN-3]|nr:class I SAM-dependent methyltransferase [Cyanobacteria bacterium SZAS LIN-3]MBS2005738.1 class I SAM-dependent methyltransferase [Cyanobacteria bacterium SZAS TMP-1]
MTKTTPKANWYEDFFSGAALELWRRAIPQDTTDQEIGFLVETLAAPAGGNILDLPCGNGRLSLPLALAGYKVTGVDFSAEFIEEAKQAVVDHKAKPSYLREDVRKFTSTKKFDGAFCMGNSFGYFDRAGTVEFFHAVSKCLKKGARFVIDSAMAAECFLVNGGEREWVQLGDMFMLIENKYDCRHSCVETDYTFIQNGKEEKRHAVHWIYTAGEIGHMLSQANFVVSDMYSSTEFDEFTLGSDRLLLVAEKV